MQQLSTKMKKINLQEMDLQDGLLMNQKVEIGQRSNLQKKLKAVIVIMLMVGYLLYYFLYEYSPSACISDALHDWTASSNKQLSDGYKNSDNIVIGIGQVMMDFWIVTSMVIWILKIKNSRLVYATGIFFLCRSCFLEIQKLPFPDSIVWHNPGFYSLTVPYDRTRDFYYSGHTGVLVTILLELLIGGKFQIFCIVAFTCLVYMMNMLIITRVHYTIDVIGGIIFALAIFKFVNTYLYYCDIIISLPFKLIKWTAKKLF